MKTVIIIIFIFAVVGIGMFAARSLFQTTSKYSNQYDDIERMAQSDLRLNVTPLNNSDASGMIFLEQNGNTSQITITLENSKYSRFTANIRAGTCSRYAKVQNQLTNGELSTSRTRLSVPLYMLTSDYPPLVIVIYNSDGKAIGCGNLNQ